MSNVIVADDHDLFREGIKTILKKIKDIHLVGEARTGMEAIDLYKALRPDLLVMDISMPDMNGIEATKEILLFDQEANIIILSMHDDEDYVSRCLSAGVKGYVIKSESGTELKQTIELVLQGSNYFSHKAQDVILKTLKGSSVKKKGSENELHITQREKEILNLISDGLTSQAMADKLFISIRTVETHRTNIMRKLDVRNVVELLRKAIKLHLVN